MELPPPPVLPITEKQRSRPWVVTLLIVSVISVATIGVVITRRIEDSPIDLQTLRGTILFATARNEPHLVTCHLATCNYDVYLMSADGSDVRPLIADPEPDFAGALSADGTEAIVPRLTHAGHRSELVEMDVADGRNRVLYTSPHTLTWPQFSPDGTEIAFAQDLPHAGRAVYMLDLGTHDVRQLTQTDPESEVFIDASPAWAPDGRSIAFARIADTGAGEGRVLTVDVETGEYRELFELDSPAFLDWSPDGTQIACAARTNGSTELFVLPASGEGEPTALTHDSSYEGLPAWSPDGAYIVFTSNLGGANELYVMRADGSGVTQLPSGGGPNGGTSWSVTP